RPEPPARERPLDANARGFAGDIDADGVQRPREVVPMAQRKRSDVAVRRDAERCPAVRTVQSPLHPAVSDVDDEDLAHRPRLASVRARVRTMREPVVLLGTPQRNLT